MVIPSMTAPSAVSLSGDYAFNVGMSLYEIPHNVGRMWHPAMIILLSVPRMNFTSPQILSWMALGNGSPLDSYTTGMEQLPGIEIE
jgi:hypothetical protein